MADTLTTQKLKAFEAAFLELNRHHNLVARGDGPHFWERHIMHCLALTRRAFPEGAQVVDWGTGGGLPAIPLAIALPWLHITAVDSMQKKIMAVHRLTRELKVANVSTWCGRAHAWPGKATHSVSRATAPLEVLWGWHKRVAGPCRAEQKGVWAPGLLCLKGGDLSLELGALHSAHGDVTAEVIPLDDLGAWFDEKVIVHVWHE